MPRLRAEFRLSLLMVMGELEFHSGDPLYRAAELARDALARLERVAMVGAVRHGIEKAELDMSDGEVLRA